MAVDVNLPAETTSFVDRKRELADARTLLTEGGVVTLIGVGGVGKTRLALRIADALHQRFPDGVYLVELGSLSSADLVPRAVAAVFGMVDAAEDATGALIECVRGKHLLLVMDSCEHVTPACAELLSTVLEAAPRVHVLATSRIPLGISGEHVLRVFPFDVPGVDGLISARELDAVTLFADRAAAASGFQLSKDNWSVVVRLCQKLDGIPLAIELAVGWLRALAPEQMLSRLDDTFHLWGKEGKEAFHGQRSLTPVIEWSYQLCSAQEQLFWGLFSVFAGEVSLATVEEVCSVRGLAAEDIVGLLTALVEHSIVSVRHREDGTRYRMLEVIRQRGRVRLRELGAETQLRIRHRDHYLRFAEQSRRDWLGGTGQAEVHRRVQRERQDLRAALEFCLSEPGEAMASLRLATALPHVWLYGGCPAEGRYWLERLLAVNQAPSRDRATALWILAFAAALLGQPTVASPLAKEAEAWALKHRDDTVLGYARLVLGGCAFLTGDFVGAAALFQEIRNVQQASGNYDSAFYLSQFTVAQAEIWSGQPMAGIKRAERALDFCDTTGEQWARTHLYYCLGLGHWILRRDLRTAEICLLRAVRNAEPFHDVIGVALVLEILTSVTAALGRYERAAELLGVNTKVWPLLGGAPQMNLQRLIDTHRENEREVREALGSAFDDAFARGRTAAVTFGHVVAYVLDGARGIGGVHAGSTLTQREWQVAGLVAERLTNQEIADQLAISRRTAETHVDRILRKLGLTSRTQLAMWMDLHRHDS
ncbi:ATP-binding protein [Kibdelosporangium aridum]|uniref:ATP-binding protein n=1 Tax=Kibdelosporangium aridum TaxID=2030 RepID=UPI0035E4EBCC